MRDNAPTFDKHSVDQLLGIIAAEPRVLPVRPMEALLRRGDEAFPRLLALMRGEGWKDFPNPIWPVILLGLLAAGRDPRAAAPVIRAVLQEGATGGPGLIGACLCTAAAEALARLGPDAIPEIREGLERDEEPVRIFLYAALGWTDVDAASELLVAAADADLDLADAIASALRDAGRGDAIETLHRLLGRCDEEHFDEVEGAILDLHHRRGRSRPLENDWRLRYRPFGASPVFDPTWAGVACLVRPIDSVLPREEIDLPAPSLEEILAEPPAAEPSELEGPCAVCGEPGRVQFGLPACGTQHAASLASIQHDLLMPWADEGVDDLFEVLGDIDGDLLTLRHVITPRITKALDPERDPERDQGAELSEGPAGTIGLTGVHGNGNGRRAGSGGGDGEQSAGEPARGPTPGETATASEPFPETTDDDVDEIDDLESELSTLRTTCRWFLGRGEEDLGGALGSLRPAMAPLGRSGRVSPDTARQNPPPGGLDAPCPCGSGLKYKACCGWDEYAALLDGDEALPEDEDLEEEDDPEGDALVDKLFQDFQNAPLEVRRGTYFSIMGAFFDEWFGLRRTDLAGLTPAEAATLVVGRRRVERVLGKFEAFERDNLPRQGFRYDLSWVYETVGLDPPQPEAKGG